MPLARNHMSRSLLTVEPGLGLKAVAERMVDKDVGAVLVIEHGRLVGILTSETSCAPSPAASRTTRLSPTG